MMKKTRSKGIWKRTALDGLFYLLGSVLYALSVNIFTAPNQIAPGGVTPVWPPCSISPGGCRSAP